METASTTTKDFEAQEVEEIEEAIEDYTSVTCKTSDPNYYGACLLTLVKVLVANGTLTSKQVKRALKKDEEL